MRKARFGKAAMLLGAASLAAIACAPVEKWDVFEVDWDQRLERQPVRPVSVPEELKPTAEDRDVELPEAGPLELSLEEAALMALGRNRDLSVQQMQPVITGAFELIERGQYDPRLFADLQYNEESASETNRATGGQFAVEGRDTTAVAGVEQRLPTGTTIQGTAEQERSASNRAPEQQQARLGVSITQSLLQGFGPAVNLASVRQAELDTLASVYELRGFTEALLAEAEITYWLFTLARQEIAIFEEALAVAQQQREDVAQRVAVGVLAETELPAARAEVARREQALIDARSELEVQRLQLARLINAHPAGLLDRPIVPTTEPRLVPSPIDDLPERVQLALRLRPDLGEARLRLEQDRLETIVTRNGLLPRLDLFIALGKSGFGDRFGESFDELDGESDDMTAGITFEHLLGNRAAEGADIAARATRQQSAAALANLQQLVRLDVRLAATEVDRARQQVRATAATRELQERTVEAEQARFEVGTSTALLVAQAQRDLLEAQIAEVEAIVQYRIALVELYLAEGSLLERRGIKLAESRR